MLKQKKSYFMISFFRAPIRNTKPSAQASLSQIYKYIISNRASDITRRLRAITDPKEARKYKSEAFDYVTFSGCFSSRCTDELIEHSGFLCFDIDKIESEERLLKLKSDLVADEELHTVLLFRSPSGNGLKWVVEVPDRHWLRSYSPPVLGGTDERSKSRKQVHLHYALQGGSRQRQMVKDRGGQNINIIKNHRLLYERIRQYLLTQYGIATDHTSDIARPCYLCHDADAYYDPPTFKDNPASRFLKVGTRHAVSDNPQNNLDINQQTTNNPLVLRTLPLKQGENTSAHILSPCVRGTSPTGGGGSTVDKNKTNYENDIEKIVREIEHRRIDITNDYHNWMLVAMALAGTYGSFGEQYFHRISQFHPKYNHTEAHRMYQSCLRNTHGAVGIGTIVYLMNR